MIERNRGLGGYDPNAGHAAHLAGSPQLIPVPSLLRSLLSEHLDPGYAAAAAERDRTGTDTDGGPGRTSARSWLWQGCAALLVAAVFAAAAAQARVMAPGVHQAQQLLASNVRSAKAATDDLGRHRNTLRAEVDDLQRHRLNSDTAGRRLLARLDELNLAAGSTPVIGPGLTVTVTDPGVGRNLSDVSKQRVSGSQQIILDRDLQLVVNALWAGGAEAISVDDVRIGPNVTIRQAGGAILVDNAPISSPYTILAVGPPRTMRDDFDRSPARRRLANLEMVYGVGVRISEGDGLALSAAAIRNVRFAQQMGA